MLDARPTSEAEAGAMVGVNKGEEEECTTMQQEDLAASKASRSNNTRTLTLMTTFMAFGEQMAWLDV
jgi:hypothetical protein